MTIRGGETQGRGPDHGRRRAAVTDEATAEWFYQKFKWDVLAPLEADRWALDTGDILVGWSRRRGRTTSCHWRRPQAGGFSWRQERESAHRTLDRGGEAGAGES